jgi:hypothetical protein
MSNKTDLELIIEKASEYGDIFELLEETNGCAIYLKITKGKFGTNTDTYNNTPIFYVFNNGKSVCNTTSKKVAYAVYYDIV